MIFPFKILLQAFNLRKNTFILYTVNRFGWRNQGSLLIDMKEPRNYLRRHFLRRRGGVKLTENPEKSLGAKCRNPNETMGEEFSSVSSGVLYHFPRVEPAFPSAKDYKGLKCLPPSYEIDGVIEQSGLDILREVNVYITSRLNGGRRKSLRLHGSAWNHNNRMLIRRASIARVLDRVGSSSCASRRQYLPSRYNFESANEGKCRSRVHSANVTRNRKNAYQSRDTTSIRIFRLILSVISLNKHCVTNYFRGTACD